MWSLPTLFVSWHLKQISRPRCWICRKVWGQTARLSSSGFCGLYSKHVHAESKENRMYIATLNIHILKVSWFMHIICLTKIKQILHDHDKVCVLVTMRFCSQLRSEDEAPPGNSLRFQAASAWLRFPAGELLQKRLFLCFFLWGPKKHQNISHLFSFPHSFHSLFSSILLGQYFSGDPILTLRLLRATWSSFPFCFSWIAVKFGTLVES